MSMGMSMSMSISMATAMAMVSLISAVVDAVPTTVALSAANKRQQFSTMSTVPPTPSTPPPPTTTTTTTTTFDWRASALSSILSIQRAQSLSLSAAQASITQTSVFSSSFSSLIPMPSASSNGVITPTGPTSTTGSVSPAIPVAAAQATRNGLRGGRLAGVLVGSIVGALLLGTLLGLAIGYWVGKRNWSVAHDHELQDVEARATTRSGEAEPVDGHLRQDGQPPAASQDVATTDEAPAVVPSTTLQPATPPPLVAQAPTTRPTSTRATPKAKIISVSLDPNEPRTPPRSRPRTTSLASPATPPSCSSPSPASPAAPLTSDSVTPPGHRPRDAMRSTLLLPPLDIETTLPDAVPDAVSSLTSMPADGTERVDEGATQGTSLPTTRSLGQQGNHILAQALLTPLPASPSPSTVPTTRLELPSALPTTPSGSDDSVPSSPIPTPAPVPVPASTTVPITEPAHSTALVPALAPAVPMAHQPSGPSDNTLPSVTDLYTGTLLRLGATVRVLYTYNAQMEDELSLVRGDVLRLVRLFDDGWALGQRLSSALVETRGEDSGAFPLVCVSAATAASPARSVGRLGVPPTRVALARAPGSEVIVEENSAEGSTP